MNERFCISIPISLNFVPKGPIENKFALVQVMAWRRTGDKPLVEQMLTPISSPRCVYSKINTRIVCVWNKFSNIYHIPFPIYTNVIRHVKLRICERKGWLSSGIVIQLPLTMPIKYNVVNITRYYREYASNKVATLCNNRRKSISRPHVWSMLETLQIPWENVTRYRKQTTAICLILWSYAIALEYEYHII